MRGSSKRYPSGLTLEKIEQASLYRAPYDAKWPGWLRRLNGVRRRTIPPLAKAVFIILFFAGWYGAWASHENAYDQGWKDAAAEKSHLEYDRGVKDGRETMRRELNQENLSSVDAQVRAKVQEYEEGLNQQMNVKMAQAYQAGESDYARRIIEHDMQFTSSKAVKK